MPGAGKTILTAIAINDLITRFDRDPDIGLAYINSIFRRQGEHRVDALLANLLKQLSQARPCPPESVVALRDKHKRMRTRPSCEELSEAIHCVAPTYSRVFIVVDALDECQTSDGCRSSF